MNQKNFIALLIFVGIIAGSLAASKIGYIILFGFLAMFIIIILLTRDKVLKKNFSFLIKISSVGILIRIIIVSLYFLFPDLLMPSDAIAYQAKGWEISNSWKSGSDYVLEKANWLYYYINAIPFYFLGYHPEILHVLNACVSILTALNIYKLGYYLKINNQNLNKVFIIVVFLPSFIFWSTMNLKDTIIIYCITSILLNLILLISSNITFNHILFLSINILVLTSLRFYIGIVVAITSILLISIFLSKSSLVKRLTLCVLFIGIMGVILQSLGYGFLGASYLSQQSIETISDQRSSSSYGGSVNLESEGFNSNIGALYYFPKGLIYFFLSPFPWDVNNIIQLLAMVETILLYPYLWAIIKGMLFKFNNKNFREIKMVLMFVFPIILLYSLGLTNGGQIYRMKLQVILFLILIGSHFNIINKGETINKG